MQVRNTVKRQVQSRTRTAPHCNCLFTIISLTYRNIKKKQNWANEWNARNSITRPNNWALLFGNTVRRREKWPNENSIKTKKNKLALLTHNLMLEFRSSSLFSTFFSSLDCLILFCGFSSQNRNVIGLDNCFCFFSLWFSHIFFHVVWKQRLSPGREQTENSN